MKLLEKIKSSSQVPLGLVLWTYSKKSKARRRRRLVLVRRISLS